MSDAVYETLDDGRDWTYLARARAAGVLDRWRTKIIGGEVFPDYQARRSHGSRVDNSDLRRQTSIWNVDRAAGPNGARLDTCVRIFFIAYT